MNRIGRSFNKMNLLLIACIALLTVIICAVMYYYARDIVIREKKNMYLSYLKQLNSNINTKLNEAVALNQLFVNDLIKMNVLDKLIENKEDRYEINKISTNISKDILFIETFSKSKFSFILLGGVSLEFKNGSLNIFSKNKESIKNLKIFTEHKKALDSGKTVLISSKSQKEQIINYLIPERSYNYQFLRKTAYLDIQNHIMAVTGIRTRSGDLFLSIIVIDFTELANFEKNIYLRDLFVLNNKNDLIYQKDGFNMDIFVKKILTQKLDENNGILQISIGSRNYNVFFDLNKNAGFTLFHTVSTNLFSKETNDLKIRLLVLLIPLLLFTCIVTYVFCNINVFIPIKNLLSLINNKDYSSIQAWRKNHKWNNMSINSKYFLVFMLSFIIPNLFLIWNCYVKTCNILEECKLEYLEAMSVYTSLNIESLMQNYENVARYIIFQDEVQNFLSRNSKTGVKINSGMDITKSVIGHTFNMNGINNIRIFNIKGKLIYTLMNNTSNSYGQGLNKFILDLEDISTFLIKPTWQFYKKEDGEIVMLMQMAINGYGNQAIIDGISWEYKKIGYISLEITEMIINRVYINIDTRYQNVILLDASNKIISSSLSSYNGDSYVNFIKRNYEDISLNNASIITNEIGDNGWKVVMMINTKNIQNDVSAIILSGYILLLVIIFLMSLIIIALINSLIMPIYELNSDLINVKEKDGSLTYIEKDNFNYDEISQLGNSFNALIGRINYLIGTVYTAKINQGIIEKKKHEIELNALQSQINPHFIYNTLESIKWMIKLNKNSEALSMIELFGKLLKISINRGRIIVPVLEELEHVETYIGIQKIRFRERLIFKYEIEDDLLEYGIVKLMLQPLVENSLIHGFKDKNSILVIVLTIIKYGDSIIIKVIDNGCGIEPFMAEEINQKLKLETAESIGLKNVHDRVKIYFGDNSSFKIESSYGKGTAIEIVIPAIKGVGGNYV